MTPRTWARIAVLGGLFVALHYDIVYRLVRIWWSEGDWSHGFLIPLLAVYFIREDRHRIAGATPRTYWPGLLLLIGAIIVYVAGLHPLRSDMAKGYAMVAGLAGLTLWMVGPAVMRYLWVPILLLGLAVKVSPPIWEAVAWRMQLIAADAAVAALNLMGVEAERTVTQITLRAGTPGEVSLTVARACSGMRMLMAFVTVGVAVAYLGRRPVWSRIALVAMTLPVAIAVNVGRVIVLGLLSLIDVGYAGGDFHTFVGMVLLLPGLLMFLGAAWVVDRFNVRGSKFECDPDGSRGLTVGLEEGRGPRPFIAAATVLLTAAVALHGATAAMGWHFIKRPVPLRQRLYLLPETMGPYVKVKTEHERLSPELAEELGAGEHILWMMRDTHLAEDQPGARLRLYVSYRTGWPDSRLHLPNRAALLSGGPASHGYPRPGGFWGGHRGEPPRYPFEYMFRSDGETNIVYQLGIANGNVVLIPSAMGGRLSDPSIVSTWCATVEVQPLGITEHVAGTSATDRFLAHAMPHILDALPAKEGTR